jgi:hypothetical protein
MTLSDLGAIAEMVGGAGILASLIYLNIQFRQTKKSDEREAAFELIRSFQTIEFTRMLQVTYDLPVGLPRKELDRRIGDELPMLYSYFATWESLGIMVQRRQINLDLVCDFFSHSILQSWAVMELYIAELRQEMERDTIWEWFQWLAERVKEQESTEAPIPAYVEFRNWK